MGLGAQSLQLKICLITLQWAFPILDSTLEFQPTLGPVVLQYLVKNFACLWPQVVQACVVKW